MVASQSDRQRQPQLVLILIFEAKKTVRGGGGGVGVTAAGTSHQSRQAARPGQHIVSVSLRILAVLHPKTFALCSIALVIVCCSILSTPCSHALCLPVEFLCHNYWYTNELAPRAPVSRRCRPNF